MGCPINGCHPAFEDWQGAASCDPATVSGWWAHHGHSVLLATGIAFDVIETPGDLGVAAVRLMTTATAGPVAVTPTGRWMFFVRHGDALRPELAEQLQVLLHAGNSWVPAPPTRFPEGRVRWRVTPEAARWRLPDTYLVQRLLVEVDLPRMHQVRLPRPALRPRVADHRH